MRYIIIIILSSIIFLGCESSGSDNTLFDLTIEPEHLVGKVGEEQTFMAVTDVDVSTIRFAWVFGDRTDTVDVLRSPYVNHTFAEPGNYIIEVQLFDIRTSTPFIKARSYATINK